MIIKKAEFITSAAAAAQYPPAGVKEIAFAGRSNVGKSSLINLLVGRKALARVSSSPGKTRTINFFNINDAFRIVDLPGYGFARVSKAEQAAWGKMIETYLSKREDIAAVVLLVDSRREPSAQDIQMYEWLKYYGLSGIVAVTKTDKISKSELNKNISLVRRSLSMEQDDPVLPVSSLKRTGVEELSAAIGGLLGL